MRRARVAELYKERRSANDIRQILFSKYDYQISHKTIQNDIRVLRQQYIKQGNLDVEEALVRELIELDSMEEECNRRLSEIPNAWQGARWMEERRKIKQHRAKLLGLFAPDKRVQLNVNTEIRKEDRDGALNAALADLKAVDLTESAKRIPHDPDAIDAEFDEVEDDG